MPPPPLQLSAGPRSKPVEFERPVEEADPFGLDQFLDQVRAGVGLCACACVLTRWQEVPRGLLSEPWTLSPAPCPA